MKFELDQESGCFNLFGVEVMTFNDNYPSGHQSGVTLIMNDRRMAQGIDVRFEQTPGQWQPVPVMMDKKVEVETESVTVNLHYPDTNAHLKGFNPIIYPDVELDYAVVCRSIDKGIEVSVELKQPLPECLKGKASLNLEMVPVHLFGKSWMMDNQSGIFPRQPNGPAMKLPANCDVAGIYPLNVGHADLNKLIRNRTEYSPMVADDLIAIPYAQGKKFAVTPEDPKHSFSIVSDTQLNLYDGRFNHNNGWFVLNSELPTGVTGSVISWKIYPRIERLCYEPVVEVSNVGYHPLQSKYAIVEMDKTAKPQQAQLYRIGLTGKQLVTTMEPMEIQDFLRYQYAKYDFSDVKDAGVYMVNYGQIESNLFRIDSNVYERGVWQPVLEYFLPVQMCHMRVSEKYRVWHGYCHRDDALMAPVNYNHFDGYVQGPSTLTKYKSLEHVPGLDAGGWHDAGDYDLRIESQAGEVYNLSLIRETFQLYYDATTINQERHLVEIHQPDGKNDIQQQIEHGLLSIIGGYRSLGRLYRGIICNDIRQYVLLGDASVMTDGISGTEDDRWVFTEDNPQRELSVAAQLAAAARAMRHYNDSLGEEALEIAEELYSITNDSTAKEQKLHAAIELLLTTKKDEYKQYILANVETIENHFEWLGWVAVRAIDAIGEATFTAKMRMASESLNEKYKELCEATPYGVPYRPGAWGAGWGIQGFGARYYHLYKAFPDIFPTEPMTSALNFILGCHPGTNTASFASGVGSQSHTVAYGANRADYSYIPGGVSSGTELIAPDFPELLEFPFLWQQGEYVMGGGSSNYLFLVLAVQSLYNGK